MIIPTINPKNKPTINLRRTSFIRDGESEKSNFSVKETGVLVLMPANIAQKTAIPIAHSPGSPKTNLANSPGGIP